MLLQLETNTRCNLSCWFCQNRHFPLQKSEIMPFWLYQDAVKQGVEAGIHRVSHAAYNEPMADPMFIDRLMYLKEKKVDYVGYSNGTLLNVDTIRSMVTKGLDWPHTFNVPAADKDAYKKATDSTADVNRVIEVIKFYARHSRCRHTIDVNGTGDADHLKNFRELVQRFGDLPNVDVKMVKIITRAGQMTGTCQTDFKAQDLLQLGTRKSDPIVGCAAAKLVNYYVGVNGDVYLCCHDHEKKYVVGNVKQTPLKAIRDSQEYQDVLRQMQREFCSNCESAVYARKAGAGARTRADLPHQLQPPHFAQGDGGPAKPSA